MSQRPWRPLAFTTVLSTVLALLPTPAATASPAPTSVSSPSRPVTVTLVSGDQVVVNGSNTTFRAALGRRVGYFRWVERGRVHVAPTDAMRLIGSKLLDRRLFDVTGLVEQGYTRGELPLIVTYQPGARTRMARPSGAAPARQLPAVNGEAVRQRAKDAPVFWQTLTSPSARSSGGVRQVWLDARVRTDLDRSAAQVGAPTAWQAGYTGKGVPVAVLDTGYDSAHPDLKNAVAESKDFTGSSRGARDGDGHGTHVAGTVAGSGAASEGRYRGIAPGARLLVGKVLGDEGEGQLSWVIAGMEWAAARARVVNMSLGGAAPLDGPDPVEQALDTLTARHGTLFVVSAGNSGHGFGMIGSPGTAASALTVASVNKSDQLSSFSSFGPRSRDGAMKPDIAAPGGAIVAARATGTLTPMRVGEHYAQLDGTSMASPHVAGAAAILAQAHPDWKADRLKAALMASGEQLADIPVLGQGAGRLDIPAALSQGVYPLTPAVSLAVTEPYTTPAKADLVYRNDTRAAVVLRLTVDSADAQGRPAGKLTLSANQLTVPAGGTARIAVTGTAKGEGTHAGRVIATAPHLRLATPVSLGGLPRYHTVTARVLGRDGRPVESGPMLIDEARGRFHTPDESTSWRVPTGRYRIIDTITEGEDQIITVGELTAVDHDTTITLRPSRISRLDLGTENPAAKLTGTDVTLKLDGVPAATGAEGFEPAHVLVSSPDPVGGDQPYVLSAHAMFQDAASARYLSTRFRGAFPDTLRYRPRDSELATIRTRLRQPAPGALLATSASAEPRVMFSGNGAPDFSYGKPVGSPGTRTLRVSPLPEATWNLSSGAGYGESFDHAGWDSTVLRGLRAGQTYQRTALAAPFGPAFGTGRDSYQRLGNLLYGGMPVLSGAGAGHSGEVQGDAKGTLTLLRGREVRDSVDLVPHDGGGYEAIAIPSEPGLYTLRAAVVRPKPWTLSTRVEAAWTFRSAEPAEGRSVALPLLTVRYSPELDDRNTAAGDARLKVPVLVERQQGSGPLRLASLRVEASYDAGRTWAAAPVSGTGASRSVELAHPRGPGFVSLRAVAVDADGSAVTQTLVQAYALR